MVHLGHIKRFKKVRCRATMNHFENGIRVLQNPLFVGICKHFNHKKMKCLYPICEDIQGYIQVKQVRFDLKIYSIYRYMDLTYQQIP